MEKQPKAPRMPKVPVHELPRDAQDPEYQFVINQSLISSALQCLGRNSDYTIKCDTLAFQTGQDAKEEWQTRWKATPGTTQTPREHSYNLSQWAPNEQPSSFVTPGNPAFAPYVPGVAWDQQIFFKALTETRIPPGGKTQYGECCPARHWQPADSCADVTPLTENVDIHDRTDFVYG